MYTFTIQKIKMPEASIRNKMRMDQIDAYWVRDFFGEPQPIIKGGTGGGRVMKPPCAKPDMAKYERMKVSILESAFVGMIIFYSEST